MGRTKPQPNPEPSWYKAVMLTSDNPELWFITVVVKAEWPTLPAEDSFNYISLHIFSLDGLVPLADWVLFTLNPHQIPYPIEKRTVMKYHLQIKGTFQVGGGSAGQAENEITGELVVWTRAALNCLDLIVATEECLWSWEALVTEMIICYIRDCKCWCLAHPGV